MLRANLVYNNFPRPTYKECGLCANLSFVLQFPAVAALGPYTPQGGRKASPHNSGTDALPQRSKPRARSI